MNLIQDQFKAPHKTVKENLGYNERYNPDFLFFNNDILLWLVTTYSKGNNAI